MEFPDYRPRRMRRTERLRRMVRETRLSIDHLIMPLFVVPGRHVTAPISSMPGVAHLSVDRLVEECRAIHDLGIPAVILFGVPDQKDALASAASDAQGIVPQALRAVKAAVPGLTLITDVCLCSYTDHGHCGVLAGDEIANDASVEILAQTAVAHAEAGADIVAPSDMMDGRVGAIRTALDDTGLDHVAIMSYAAKYASAFYGPFRDAADSAPQFGDRRSYQMDPGNTAEALREVELDIREGADIVMVKPALAYLDVIQQVKQTYHHPVAAYNVSGEFSMIKAAAQQGWIDEERAMLEALTAMHRAGADMILTYFAKDAARALGA